jgi:hypothetical protein
MRLKMPFPEHPAYQDRLVAALNELAQDPDRRRSIDNDALAILILYHLDLTPALPFLQQGYADSPRGSSPWSPLAVLRALLLGHLIGAIKPRELSKRLRACPLLRSLAGFSQEEMDAHDLPAPGGSTFYDFFHRLFDGPRRTACDHERPPSQLQAARARTPQPRKARAADTDTTSEKKTSKPSKSRKARRARREAQKNKARAHQIAQGVTDRLVQQLKAARDQGNPNDLTERLGCILLDCAVIESAKRGLLGDVTALITTGDGSPLPTAADGHGQRVCDCEKTTRCDCPRGYSDPDAAWGWDHYREVYYFGHSFYEVSVTSEGRDLPLTIELHPANESDHTASVKAMDRLHKRLRSHAQSFCIDIFVADAGHDSLAEHRFHRSWSVRPVIPLANKAPATHPSRGEVQLSERGVPMCEAKLEMSPWGSAGHGDARRPLFLCPVGAGKLARCPLAPEAEPEWSCRPELKRGPAVTVSPKDDPRMFPLIPRNSERYKELYRMRSGTERSNNLKKGVYALPGCRHRRASFWLIRLHLAALLQHAKAWVADLDARVFVAQLLGETQEAAA